jgi:hypothetical protein
VGRRVASGDPPAGYCSCAASRSLARARGIARPVVSALRVGGAVDVLAHADRALRAARAIASLGRASIVIGASAGPRRRSWA